MVVLAVFVYNLPIQFSSVPSDLWPGIGVIVSAGLCAPYLWRRRYPLGTFLSVQAAAVVQLGLGIGVIPADVMLLPVLYTLATRRQWYVSAPVGLLVVGWLLVTVVPSMRRDHLSVGDVGVLVGLVIWAWTWGWLVQIRRRYIAGLREHTIQLEREKEAQAAIAAASERARIAREIHDIVSHSLSVVVVMSDGAAAKVETEPERARAAMLSVRDTGRTALAEMRRMLGVLRDGEPGSHAPQPGIAGVGELVEASVNAGLPVTLSVEGTPVPVPGSVDLAVYRVVQEALTNVRKHAGPDLSRVEVQLRYRDGEIEARVTDDGRGVSESSESGGHGLVGMRERVAAHGGSIRAQPRPEGGFEVVAVLPGGEGS